MKWGKWYFSGVVAALFLLFLTVCYRPALADDLSYTYDDLDRLTSMVSNDGSMLATMGYAFDAVGNITRIDTSISMVDTDSDQMPDGWETAHGLNPNDPADAQLDPDGDGLSNLAEYQAGTDPSLADTDGDGLDDGTELLKGTDPLVVDVTTSLFPILANSDDEYNTPFPSYDTPEITIGCWAGEEWDTFSNGIFRFAQTSIPKGVEILAAKLWMGGYTPPWLNPLWLESHSISATAHLNIMLTAEDNPAMPKSLADFVNMPLTQTSVLWETGKVEQYETKDFASVVQEVINRPGWASGNALQVIIKPAPRWYLQSEMIWSSSFEGGTPAVLEISYK